MNSYFTGLKKIFLGFDVDLFLFVQEIVTCVLGRVWGFRTHSKRDREHPAAFPNREAGVRAEELKWAGHDAGAPPVQKAGPGSHPHPGFGFFGSR